ncbi:MAG: ATP-dependent Clp protease proteolytic subunit [Clostridia bacterium]|nr:ATP-dependent Clp protease proteolytic subunit [Clostridia bacterium]MBQ3154055.1 ATP-dependent Clp protease proteolytic subunit [Clostridia bacterium]
MIVTPQFFEKEGGYERSYDPFSRLLKDRIILLFNEVNDDLACTIIAQMLYLEAVDPQRDICLYINSPGGSVSAGLGIYDTMRHLKCDVSTICVGMAASMGAFLLSAGTKGKRYALPNSQIMIHQVLGGAQGQATDVEIEARHMLDIKQRLNTLMAANVGKPVEEVTRDTERNNWMFPAQALEYGLIDKILED